MKKIVALLLSAVVLMSCTACSNKEKTPEVGLQESQMKSICELSVMECYYHNVAKYKEENAEGILFWKKDKHFWIEYSGIVSLGIDASLVSMSVQDSTVTITIPEARVLACKVDSNSLSEDSFIVDQKSARIDAEDETAAFAEAQKKMEESAASNGALLRNAQQRVQTLLENYVHNIGDAIGKDYSIEWVILRNEDSSQSTAPDQEAAVDIQKES